MHTKDSPAKRLYRGAAAADRQAERRARLLAAATRLIGSEGYAATSVKRVCTEAGLTERYFYESFDNMEDILCAAYVHITDALWADLIVIAQGAPPTPHDRIAAVLPAYVAAIDNDRNGARLVLLEIAGARSRGDAAYRTEMARAADVLHRHICAGLPEHPPNGLSPVLLMRGLLGAVYQMAREWLLGNCREPAEDLVRNASAIFDGVIAQWLA